MVLGHTHKGFGLLSSGLGAGSIALVLLSASSLAQTVVEVEQVGTKRCYVAGVQTYLKKDVKVKAPPGVTQLDLSFQPNEKCLWEPYRVLSAPSYPTPPAAAMLARQNAQPVAPAPAAAPAPAPAALPAFPQPAQPAAQTLAQQPAFTAPAAQPPAPQPSFTTRSAPPPVAPQPAVTAPIAPSPAQQPAYTAPVAQPPVQQPQFAQPAVQPQVQQPAFAAAAPQSPPPSQPAPYQAAQQRLPEPPVASPVAVASRMVNAQPPAPQRLAAASPAPAPTRMAPAAPAPMQVTEPAPAAVSAPPAVAPAAQPAPADQWGSSNQSTYEPQQFSASNPVQSAPAPAAMPAQAGAPISLLPQSLLAAAAATPSDADTMSSQSLRFDDEPTPAGMRDDNRPELIGRSERFEMASAAVSAPPAAAAPQRVAAPSITPGGRYWAQLASVGSEDKAFSAWDMIKTENQSVLANAQATILPASFDDGRTLFRVRVGPMTQTDAADLCKMISPCFVTRD